MSVLIIESQITRKYLMNKTKSELAFMYLDLLDAKTALEAENAALRRDLLKLNADEASALADVTRLLLETKRERDALRAALEIYATPDNWRQKDTRTGAFDWFLRGNAGWDIAQAALAEQGGGA